jgi:hypothetical protein
MSVSHLRGVTERDSGKLQVRATSVHADNGSTAMATRDPTVNVRGGITLRRRDPAAAYAFANPPRYAIVVRCRDACTQPRYFP